MSALPESGRSNLLKWPDIRVRFRPGADIRHDVFYVASSLTTEDLTPAGGEASVHYYSLALSWLVGVNDDRATSDCGCRIVSIRSSHLIVINNGIVVCPIPDLYSE